MNLGQEETFLPCGIKEMSCPSPTKGAKFAFPGRAIVASWEAVVRQADVSFSVTITPKKARRDEAPGVACEHALLHF